MKRILTVLVAMLIMTAMMVATVAPAFADNPNLNPAGKKHVPGHTQNPNPGK